MHTIPHLVMENARRIPDKPALLCKVDGTWVATSWSEYAEAVARAAKAHPSLAKRRVSPHCIRHSTAMHMLQSGAHFNDIALYLGHETPATTHQYVEANLAMKEQALARLEEPHTVVPRYRPPDELRRFLEDL